MLGLGQYESPSCVMCVLSRKRENSSSVFPKWLSSCSPTPVARRALRSNKPRSLTVVPLLPTPSPLLSRPARTFLAASTAWPTLPLPSLLASSAPTAARSVAVAIATGTRFSVSQTHCQEAFTVDLKLMQHTYWTFTQQSCVHNCSRHQLIDANSIFLFKACLVYSLIDYVSN